MPTAKLRDTPIRHKLLLLTVTASLAFLAVVLLFGLGWRTQEQLSSRVSATTIPVLRDSSTVMLNIASVSTELFRYVHHFEPSPYRIRDALDGARNALRRIEKQEVPAEVRGSIQGLLPLISRYEADLTTLSRHIERENPVGVSDLHARMGAEGSLMLGAVERMHGQLGDSIAAENESGARQASARAGLAGVLGIAFVLGALLTMVLVRRDLEGGLEELRHSILSYAAGKGGSVKPLDRGDEIGELSRFLAQQEKARLDQIKLTRDLIDGNPNATYVKDEKGRFLEINAAYTRQTGLTQQQVAGRTTFDLYPESRARAYDRQDRELLARGEGSSAIEVEVAREDGRRQYYLVSKSILKRADGSVRGLVGTLAEVTQLKQAEQKLMEQMELTRDLIRFVPNPLFHKDGDFRFVNVNPAWEKMSGIPAEKAIGGLVKEVYPAEFADAFEKQDLELLTAPDGTNSMEITIPGRKRTRHYILTKALLKREDGSLRGMVGSCTEITELKRIDAELRNQMALTRALIDSNPNAIYLKDPDCRYAVVNDAWLAMTGTTRERAVGRNVLELFPEKESERYDAEDRRLLALGQGASEVESLRTGPDGKPQWVIIRKSVLRRADGLVAGLIGTNTDITALKRIEEDLRRSREEAMQAAQAKSAFLAAMSHEIRTPLNGVLGMAGLLADTRLSAEQREYVDTIRVSGDALLSVINDVLDYSKIESGRMTLEAEPLEPVRAVEEALEILGEQARSKRIELIAEMDESVPAWVRGDLPRLRQVLVNLVGNAVKFTERGEVVVRMSATPAGALAVSVTDTGIGIPRERLDALFQPFTQADASTTRKYGGTGLGLAISRRLVELMGGRLGAESTPGAGSTFSFDVRAAACEASVRVAAPAAEVSLTGRRILVVDDNATNLRIVRRQLERWGAVPVAVAAPAAALELLGRDRGFDAALLDYHMPEMDGVMLARRIKASAKGLPLVLLSSSMYRRAEEAEAGLFVQQLLKPVRQSHLREALSAALGGKRRQPARARRAAPARAAGPGRLRVLVVDDVEVNRRLAQALLRKLGHGCDTAASGLEAIEAAGAGKHDVVLMDVQMPDIDGMEAMRRIRQRMGARAPRIVAMTANAMPGDRERYLAAGMDGYLAKPIDPQALAAEVSGVEAGAALLDRTRLDALLKFGGADRSLLSELIEVFLRDARRYVEELAGTIARRDLAQAARAAHALKGAASNAGAKALAEIAARIEERARKGTAEGLDALREALNATFSSTVTALAGLKPR